MSWVVLSKGKSMRYNDHATHKLMHICNRYKGGFKHELKEENYLRWVSIIPSSHTISSADLSSPAQGVVAIVFFTLLVFGSFRSLRNRAYELFLLSHIVMVIMYMVACWLHWDKFSYWVYVSDFHDRA
jgi:hypothetical protein